jgi:N-acetylmuramoyl-L-alanine amidase
MRTISHIVVHCTGTDVSATIEGIKSYWKNEKGWKYPGYHFIIKPDGEIVQLLDITIPSNGVEGRNSSLINVCYIGGLNSQKQHIDTRTPLQKQSLLKVLKQLKSQFPAAIIQGHRDFPGVIKSCPCFNAKPEYASL